MFPQRKTSNRQGKTLLIVCLNYKDQKTNFAKAMYDIKAKVESLHFIQGQITINANLLLYGSRNLKYDQNEVIFNAAHRFIAQSKRF